MRALSLSSVFRFLVTSHDLASMDPDESRSPSASYHDHIHVAEVNITQGPGRVRCMQIPFRSVERLSYHEVVN